MEFEIITRYGDRFLDGTLITLKLVAIASLAGLLIAIPLALARVSHRSWIKVPAYCYIYLFRGTPLLIQLFLLYYGLGQFEAVRESAFWSILGDAEMCGLIGLTLNTAAYTAEILRGALLVQLTIAFSHLMLRKNFNTLTSRVCKFDPPFMIHT